MKVVFCTPTVSKPFDAYLDFMAAAAPLVTAAGWQEGSAYTVGNPYISGARAQMLRQALDARADVIVFLDHDVSADPPDLLKLIETEGDVVAGTYRFKNPSKEEYMATFEVDVDNRPIVRADGCIKANRVPAGFLKITKEAVGRFMTAYPALCYGPAYSPSVDLFNHGAHEGVWYGEDYAFSRNWIDAGGEIWLVPDMNINHHAPDKVYRGNYHEFLMRQPGGSNDPARDLTSTHGKELTHG